MWKGKEIVFTVALLYNCNSATATATVEPAELHADRTEGLFMISIAFIVPYPELTETIRRVVAKEKFTFGANINITLKQSRNLPEILEDPGYDVIVARGYTSKGLKSPDGKNLSSKPVVEIPVSIYDLIHAIDECMDGSFPEHIAVVGSFFTEEEIAILNKVFPCELHRYQLGRVEEIPALLEQAGKDGCKAFIGGNRLRLYIEKNVKEPWFDFIMIPTGEAAITKALDEAVRVAVVMMQERVNAEMFTTAINGIRDGILYISEDHTIQLVNDVCRQLLGISIPWLTGTPISSLPPKLSKVIRQSLQEKQEINNCLMSFEGRTLTVNSIPIFEKKSVTGAVVTLQDVTKIQQAETQIRQKMYEKGLCARYSFRDILHVSSAIDNLIETANYYAAAPSNVLIQGETGTGKELFAQSIHNASPRKAGPFVAINCAAIPENLLESELFGYVEGAFTGTRRGGKAGLFELAHNGTLFLDEIAELTMDLQVKLLRVLQEGEVRRIGSDTFKKIDVRIIAATNQNLHSLVQEGKFRKDLFYRLDVLKLYIPPLSERKEDIEVLFRHYIHVYALRLGIHIETVTEDALELLRRHQFEGNVRELCNIAERASILCHGSPSIIAQIIDYALYGSYDRRQLRQVPESLRKSEYELILEALERNQYNQTLTAEELGINRTTLWRKMKKYQIAVPSRNSVLKELAQRKKGQ